MAAVPSQSVASGTSTAKPYEDTASVTACAGSSSSAANAPRAIASAPRAAIPRTRPSVTCVPQHEAVEGDEHRPAAGTLDDVDRAHRCTT